MTTAYLERNSLQLARKLDPNQITGSDQYTMEPKYDGFRAGIIVKDGHVDIYSRSHKSQEGKLPLLEADLGQLPNMHLDGELIHLSTTYDIEGVTVAESDFNRTQRVMGSNPARAISEQENHGRLVFMMFDVLGWETDDLRGLPWHERRLTMERLYDSLLSGVSHLLRSPFLPPTRDTYNAIVAAGGEGVIMKDRRSAYTGTRNKAWFKVKSEHTMDVVIAGFTDGKGKYEGTVGAIRFDQWLPQLGLFAERGQCSGMNDVLRYKMSSNPEEYIGQVMEVKHFGYTSRSSDTRGLRHPQFVRLRDDKLSHECIWED